MWVIDTEADGLLEELTKLHCFVARDLTPVDEEAQWAVFCNLEELVEGFIDGMKDSYSNIKFFNLWNLAPWINKNVDGLTCHNIGGYDLPVLKKLGYIDDYDIAPDTINGKPVKITDTLSMSRTLWPDRPMPKGCSSTVYNPVTGKKDKVGTHGLAAWGYRVAKAKPMVHDWRNQPLHVYVHRCFEDVKINYLVLKALDKEAASIAKGKGKPYIGLCSGWEEAIETNKIQDFLMDRQYRDGILFDKEAAENLLERIDNWMEELEKEVEAGLPMREIPKSLRPTFPNNPFKASGEISNAGWNWLKILGYDVNDEALDFVKPPKTAFKRSGEISAAGLRYCERNGVTENQGDFIRSQLELGNTLKALPDDVMEQALSDLRNKVCPPIHEPMRMAHQADIKRYLVEVEGWRPTIWGTKDATRGVDKVEYDKETVRENLLSYIASVRESPYQEFIEDEMGVNFGLPDAKILEKIQRQARYLVTTPKFKDERGDLCVTIVRLNGEMAKKIVTWLSLRNRRSVIKSKDEKKSTGWLNEARLQIDGRIGQGHSGPTNTNRYKHRTINA